MRWFWGYKDNVLKMKTVMALLYKARQIKLHEGTSPPLAQQHMGESGLHQLLLGPLLLKPASHTHTVLEQDKKLLSHISSFCGNACPSSKMFLS